METAQNIPPLTWSGGINLGFFQPLLSLPKDKAGTELNKFNFFLTGEITKK